MSTLSHIDVLGVLAGLTVAEDGTNLKPLRDFGVVLKRDQLAADEHRRALQVLAW
jgi:hypothetical protein